MKMLRKNSIQGDYLYRIHCLRLLRILCSRRVPDEGEAYTEYPDAYENAGELPREEIVTVQKKVTKKMFVRQDENEPDPSTKIPASTQYRILFKDSCYIFMFLAGSQIFGILGAVGGSLVQEVEIWLGVSESNEVPICFTA